MSAHGGRNGSIPTNPDGSKVTGAGSPWEYHAIVRRTEGGARVGTIAPENLAWKTALLVYGLKAWEFKIRATRTQVGGEPLWLGRELTEQEWQEL